MTNTDLTHARWPDVDLFVEQPTGPQVPPPAPKPEIALGELVPGDPQYVNNPHMWEALGAGLLLLGAATGAVWSAWRDYDHKAWSYAVVLAAALLAVVFLRRFNAWDDDCTEPVDTV